MEAVRFARFIHRKQTRRYTGEAYFTHAASVAAKLEELGEDPVEVQAGFLHDTVEDGSLQDFYCYLLKYHPWIWIRSRLSHWDKLTILQHLFGSEVARIVKALSNLQTPKDGIRSERIERYHQQLLAGGPAVLRVKMADHIHNLHSICLYDPKFAKVYKAEVEALLKYIDFEISPIMYCQLQKLVR